MEFIRKILDGQFYLNDRLRDDSYSYTKDEILEDEKGKYYIKVIKYLGPCQCHPETCCHFDPYVWYTRTEKIYIDG